MAVRALNLAQQLFAVGPYLEKGKLPSVSVRWSFGKSRFRVVAWRSRSGQLDRLAGYQAILEALLLGEFPRQSSYASQEAC